MVDHIVPGKPQLILDVATGPAGVALQLAARTGARVVGVDLTEAMIRQGQRNVAHAGAEKQVQVVLGKGEQLPFADARSTRSPSPPPCATSKTPARPCAAGPGGPARRWGQPRVPRAPEPVLAVLVVGLHAAVLPVGGAITGGGTGSRWDGSSGRISAHYRRYPLAWTVRHGATPGSTTSG